MAQNLYCSRESLKRAVGLSGTGDHGLLDSHLEAASREIENQLHRKFYSLSATRYYDGSGERQLWLTDDLLSITSLKVDDDGDGIYDIELVANTDYWLWPDNSTPKTRIDLNPEGTQLSLWPKARRSVEIVGVFGYTNATVPAGTVASGLSASAAATTFVCSNAALIDVGNTLLIENEQVFVSERTANDVGKNTASALTAAVNDVTLIVEAGHGLNVGEVIQVDSEKMYIVSVSGNNLTVERAYDGTVEAAHSSGADIYVFRTLTVTRGVNGTAAATHPDGSAISKYVYPADIEALCRAEAMFNYMQDKVGQSGQIGTDAAQRMDPSVRNALWRNARSGYGIPVVA